MSVSDAGRFKYAHGLVWDSELNQPVQQAQEIHLTGQKLAEFEVWDPRPRRLAVYRRAISGEVGWRREE